MKRFMEKSDVICHHLVEHVLILKAERVCMHAKEKIVKMCVGKNGNCPHKRIIGKVFKNVHIVEKSGTGKGLVLGESCNRGDFVVDYFCRAVSATNLKKYGGIGMYSMKVGQKL